MLKFDLRRAMNDFEAKTGLKITYESLASKTEISVDTLKSLATRENYNTTLHVISSICEVLRCNPIDYLIWNTDKE
ncbi:MAG: helix-turn-helix transcriptional regulator [Bacteriovoracaceae bacterium]|nr:helix-turn-helix transcriptional regulator [Bacteriovoracaceae bacterium]